jgi:hypothetical protein
MKVYVVEGGYNYEGGQVLFVCADITRAEELVAQHKATGEFYETASMPGWYRIEEFEVEE